jgi:peptidoglycan hydrolase-like protein with peptidoglycan-binding domain
VNQAGATVLAQLDRPADPRTPPQRLRRRTAKGIVLLVVALGAVAAVVLAVTGTLTRKDKATTGVIDHGAHTALAAVTRQNLSAQTNVNATLGYARSYSVINQTQGIYTALPSPGKVIAPGQVLYRVDGIPVVLLRGSIPAYRTLSEGTWASDVTGADVAELNAALVALGYATTAEIPTGSDEFSWQTKRAVKKLQAHLGITQTGTMTLGQVVFLPTAARVTAVTATAGVPAQPGQPVLAGTSTTRDITIPLNASQQTQVKVGDKVTITLPNNKTTGGRVSAVGKVATAPQGGGAPTVTVHVTPTHPSATGDLDQAPVQVSITTATVTNALVVPVAALLALAGSGYAVEVVDAAGAHHLAQVSLGLFDDAAGLVEVTGSSLSAGQQVVVPAL